MERGGRTENPHWNLVLLERGLSTSIPWYGLHASSRIPSVEVSGYTECNESSRQSLWPAGRGRRTGSLRDESQGELQQVSGGDLQGGCGSSFATGQRPYSVSRRRSFTTLPCRN